MLCFSFQIRGWLAATIECDRRKDAWEQEVAIVRCHWLIEHMLLDLRCCKLPHVSIGSIFGAKEQVGLFYSLDIIPLVRNRDGILP